VIGAHRADVIASDGRVVELQHSSISPAEITERENFYGPGMVWLFDAIEATEDDRLLLRRQPGYRTRKHHGTGYSFRWKHARKTITWCSRPVLIDVGDDEVLWLMKMGSEPPVGGYGWMFNADYVRYWMKG
jgi:hypothetical protein